MQVSGYGRSGGRLAYKHSSVSTHSAFSYKESISSDLSVMISGVDENAIWMLAYK